MMQATTFSFNPAFGEILGYDGPEQAMDSIKDVALDLFDQPRSWDYCRDSLARDTKNVSLNTLLRKADGEKAGP